MITPTYHSRTILFIGADGFHNAVIPPDLNANLVCLSWDRTTQTAFPSGKHISEALHDFEGVDAILIIPQPDAERICSSPWLFEAVKKVPVGLIWYDYIGHTNWTDKMPQFFHIALDDQNLKGRNLVSVWTPTNESVVRPAQEYRDINVCFIGNIDCPQRKNAIGFLLNKGVPVFTGGHSDWSKLSYDQMYNYMQRSKIVLNFSDDRFLEKRNQLKGRVLEAMMCGALVIEDTNNQSRRYFKPGEDIIWYNSLDELLEKIQMYLRNDGERIRIANNGHHICKTELTLNNWWRQFIPRLINFRKIKM